MTDEYPWVCSPRMLYGRRSPNQILQIAFGTSLCTCIRVYFEKFPTRVSDPGIARSFYDEGKNIGIVEAEDRTAHRASGDKSPRVFISHPLAPLIALKTDFASSPNSDLESMVSYHLKLEKQIQRKIKGNARQSSGAIYF